MSNLQKYKQRIAKNKALAKNILRTTFCSYAQLCGGFVRWENCTKPVLWAVAVN